MTRFDFLATTPKAMENLLADELSQLGAHQIIPTLAGVSFEADLETCYKICLWSRTANRVLLKLKQFSVQSQQDLYQAIYDIDWSEHFAADARIAVTFNAKNSKVIINSHFGSLVVKDAIVDQMREKYQIRPSIDTEQPDIRINVFLQKDQAQLSLDMSGNSLHKRGYRTEQYSAPLKENLAAALLIRSNWKKIAAEGGSLIDPMCGSGTLLIEAALIAADIAPGLLHQQFGFLKWKQHEEEIWKKLIAEAEQLKATGLEKLPVITGFDKNRHAVNIALKHIANAGLTQYIHCEKRDISDARAAESWQPGLIICNPPYGERLGESEQIKQLYFQFGQTLKTRFSKWKAGIIISDQELGFKLGIRSQKPITFFNGKLECKLLRLNIEENTYFIPKTHSIQERIDQIQFQAETNQQSVMFANRLKKNLKKFKKWAKQSYIDCFRVYDADLPEYAVAIDIYQGEKTWVVVQEYEAPKTINLEKANERLAALLAEIPEILNIDKSNIYLKIRRKQKKMNQYEKLNTKTNFHIIQENNCLFYVNFEDYLDTGIFLDHRPIRKKISEQAHDKQFLNLFGYTGTASVCAAYGGAKSTTTVDMSNTYLDWAQQNFTLNKFKGNHQFIRANCMDWLTKEANQTSNRQFDLIFLDPPTFSNSKRMETAFDIQQDHLQLIKNSLKLLSKSGTLFFSTNYKKFKLAPELEQNYHIKNISKETIPVDFERNSKIHYCWQIKHP